MDARVQTYRVHAGRTHERLWHSEEQTRPAVRRQRGFRALLDLVDHELDRSIIVSLWDSRDELIVGKDNVEFKATLPHGQFASGDVRVEDFEVGRHQLAPGATAARVIRYSLTPEHSEERLRLAIERLHPVLSRQPGFVGVIDLLDRAAGTVCIFQLFDSMAAARALDDNRAFLDALPPHRYQASDLAIQYLTVEQVE
jgi:heme-degrading monooxygenase HmoA